MTNPLKNESRMRLAVLGGIAMAAVAVACAVDAPVTPNVAHATGAASAEPDVKMPHLGDRFGDTTRGWTVTQLSPDGKGVMTAWVRDKVTGEVNKVTLQYDTLRLERNGEKREFVRDQQGGRTRIAESAPLYEYQVEKAATWIAGTGSPVYPPALKAAGTGGEVLATFVVDDGGRVDPGSVRFLKSTNSEFADAVREALPNMRFAPAAVGGRAVSQHVQQSFRFSVK